MKKKEKVHDTYVCFERGWTLALDGAYCVTLLRCDAEVSEFNNACKNRMSFTTNWLSKYQIACLLLKQHVQYMLHVQYVPSLVVRRFAPFMSL